MRPTLDDVARRLGLSAPAVHRCEFVIKGRLERHRGPGNSGEFFRVLYVCVAPGVPKCGRRRWERVGG